MIQALVLLCMVGAECTKENALWVLRMPQEYASPVTCAMESQARVADTYLGQEMAADGLTLKILCTHVRQR